MRQMIITSVLVVIYLARWASAEVPSCGMQLCENVNNSRCDNGSCVCKDGFHENTNSTSCIEDLAPGEICTTSSECVANATCSNVTSADATDTLQCTCDPEFHAIQVAGASSPSCQNDLAPGSACARKDEDLECVAHATCRSGPQDAGNSSLECTCDASFHADPSDGSRCVSDILPGDNCTQENSSAECTDGATCMNMADGQPVELKCTCREEYYLIRVNDTYAFCKTDLAPGENCTKENGTDECSQNAVCRQAQSGEQTGQLQCQCANDYHKNGNSSGNASCEIDTCDDSLRKCTDAGLDGCSEINAYLTCVVASRCNHSSPTDVEEYWVALGAAKDHVAENCTYPAEGACKEQITACFNAFFKANTTCSTLDTLGACLNDVSCNASSADNNAFSLARAVHAKADNQSSCTCIREVDECVATFESAAQNRTDQEKCTSVKTLFECLFEARCQADASNSADPQNSKLSQAWSLAVDSAQSSNCSLTTENATSCPLQLSRCALLYSGGLENATSKDQQCRRVAEFEQCLTQNTTSCGEEDRLLFHNQQKAAVISYRCECLVALDSCEAQYWQQKQNSTQDVTVKCLWVSTYMGCMLQARCNLSDSVDSTRLSSAQTTANTERNNNNCKFSQAPDGGCESDVAFCSNEYNSALTGQSVDAQKKCDASRNLALCLDAARCSETAAAEQSLYNTTSLEARLRLQSLDACTDRTCFASYQMVLMCKDAYTQTLKNSTQETCSAMNDMVKCLNQKLCNAYLSSSIRASYQELMNAKDPSCQLSRLSTDAGHINSPSLLAVVVAAFIACVIAIV